MNLSHSRLVVFLDERRRVSFVTFSFTKTGCDDPTTPAI